MKKDILFYSNFCTYSKEIINNISKTPLNDNMLYVSVDDENIQLPPFITSVPTIYLINDKKIVVDEAITDWIKEKLNKSSQASQGPAQSGGDGELQAYFGSTSSSFGCDFSSIDDKDNKPFISSFTFLNDNTPNKLADVSNTPTESRNSGFDNQYEKLQQERNNEFQPLQRR